MKVIVTKTQSTFEPIMVDVKFRITSYEELKEFMEYASQHGDVYQYDGNISSTLSDLMAAICEDVAKDV